MKSRLRSGATRCFWLLALALAATAVQAIQPDEVLSDAGLEGRARAISAELRCLVCQNQSIDDSDAPLARDLRIVVRDRLKAGDTDAAIRDFVVSRYGDFVLLRPPFAARTLILWIGPMVILAAGAAGLVFARRRRPASLPEPLTADEAGRLRTVLESDPA